MGPVHWQNWQGKWFQSLVWITWNMESHCILISAASHLKWWITDKVQDKACAHGYPGISLITNPNCSERFADCNVTHKCNKECRVHCRKSGKPRKFIECHEWIELSQKVSYSQGNIRVNNIINKNSENAYLSQVEKFVHLPIESQWANSDHWWFFVSTLWSEWSWKLEGK